MGDTAGHDKLCCIQNHQTANFICRMCNVPHKCLDDPKFKYKLRDSRVLQNYFQNNSFQSIQDMGYYPCKENILLDLQYCDSRGMNMALPLESMHVICLGYMPHLVQGLSHVRNYILMLDPKMVLTEDCTMCLAKNTNEKVNMNPH